MAAVMRPDEIRKLKKFTYTGPPVQVELRNKNYRGEIYTTSVRIDRVSPYDLKLVKERASAGDYVPVIAVEPRELPGKRIIMASWKGSAHSKSYNVLSRSCQIHGPKRVDDNSIGWVATIGWLLACDKEKIDNDEKPVFLDLMSWLTRHKFLSVRGTMTPFLPYALNDMNSPDWWKIRAVGHLVIGKEEACQET